MYNIILSGKDTIVFENKKFLGLGYARYYVKASKINHMAFYKDMYLFMLPVIGGLGIFTYI